LKWLLKAHSRDYRPVSPPTSNTNQVVWDRLYTGRHRRPQLQAARGTEMSTAVVVAREKLGVALEALREGQRALAEEALEEVRAGGQASDMLSHIKLFQSLTDPQVGLLPRIDVLMLKKLTIAERTQQVSPPPTTKVLGDVKLDVISVLVNLKVKRVDAERAVRLAVQGGTDLFFTPLFKKSLEVVQQQ
jgi:hypothetical protein